MQSHIYWICQDLLDKIAYLKIGLKIVFLPVAISANSVARTIAKSVTRDGRFRLYIVFGRPAWLHNQVFDEESE